MLDAREQKPLRRIDLNHGTEMAALNADRVAGSARMDGDRASLHHEMHLRAGRIIE
jgi:hypothetical protein